MNWPTFYIIALFVMLLIPIFHTEKGRQLFGETWFGFLLLLGGIFFLVSAQNHDHVVWMSRKFGVVIMDRWQIQCFGFLGSGFGVAWIFGPLRRRFRKKKDDDDNDAVR